MDLKEVKEKIEVVSSSQKNNEKMKGWLMDPEDCFGRGYDGKNKWCVECNIMCKLGDRLAPINEFCQELSPHKDEEVREKTTLTTKLEQLKSLRERKV